MPAIRTISRIQDADDIATPVDGRVLQWQQSTTSFVFAAFPAGGVPTTRQVIAGTGLSGGGALSADVTLTNSGVLSFNTRTGAVTLSKADVDAALSGGAAWLNQANTFTAAPLTVVIDADGNKGLIVKGHSATQSANLQEWQASDATPLGILDFNGHMTLRAASGYSGDMVTIKDNSGTRRGGIDSSAQFDMSALYLLSSLMLSTVNSRPDLGSYNQRGLNIPGGDTGQQILQVSALATHASDHITLRRRSSTNAEREAVSVVTTAVDNTDATRKHRFMLSAWDTAARECFRGEASGTEPKSSVNGVAAVARQLLATGAAHTVDDVITVLQNFGIAKQS